MTRIAPFCLVLALAPAIAWAGAEPASYATPQDALEAMAAALDGTQPQGALLEIFGTDAEDVLSSGNPERDAQNRAEIQTLLSEGYRFQSDADGRVTLLLGDEGWPFPVPLARGADGWAFDLEAGRDEIYFRRIGENELQVIDVMTVYPDIQIEYRLEDHDGDGILEFASSLLSDEGGRDGLFWQLEDGPLGERIARASMDGFALGDEVYEAEPFGGYYYRILTEQGSEAPGGAMSYLVNGNMLAGHALLAVPSEYGETGVHSFLVAENGVILQADLGESSLETGYGMTAYDPGAAWSTVD
ncbi:MAG: DUF2950 family protein [Pseudomonadota bacterium]